MKKFRDSIWKSGKNISIADIKIGDTILVTTTYGCEWGYTIRSKNDIIYFQFSKFESPSNSENKVYSKRVNLGDAGVVDDAENIFDGMVMWLARINTKSIRRVDRSTVDNFLYMVELVS